MTTYIASCSLFLRSIIFRVLSIQPYCCAMCSMRNCWSVWVFQKNMRLRGRCCLCWISLTIWNCRAGRLIVCWGRTSMTIWTNGWGLNFHLRCSEFTLIRLAIKYNSTCRRNRNPQRCSFTTFSITTTRKLHSKTHPIYGNSHRLRSKDSGKK